MSATLVVEAYPNTLCAWSHQGLPCAHAKGQPAPAIHVLTRSLPVAPQGTALCAYHSPVDPQPAPVARFDARSRVGRQLDRNNPQALVTAFRSRIIQNRYLEMNDLDTLADAFIGAYRY